MQHARTQRQHQLNILVGKSEDTTGSSSRRMVGRNSIFEEKGLMVGICEQATFKHHRRQGNFMTCTDNIALLGEISFNLLVGDNSLTNQFYPTESY